MVKRWRENRMIKLASLVIGIIFGLIVFHAPISVFSGRYIDPLLAKSWKEIAMLLVLPLITFIVWRAGKFNQFSRNLILRLIVLYAALHILLSFIFVFPLNQKLAGLAIDLRYLLFFVLVFCLVTLKPNLRGIFLRISAVAASISAGFAAAQAIVLPPDILKHIGYSKDTIEPYLTIDKNSDFIRINGTLRGPNPLGAYLITTFSLMMAYIIRGKAILSKYKLYFLLGVAVLLVGLWASYSRSAWLGLVLSLGIIMTVSFARRLRLWHWLVVSGILLLGIIGIFMARGSSVVQNLVVHNNPDESQSLNSNEGHANSLEVGLHRFVKQPLGKGVGSTGSASLLGKEPLVIENQYLFVAHEAGWLGLGLFVAIFFIMLGQLYKNRRDWLNLGVFASGVALAVIALVQPVFVDDTVSLVWWGVAAIALASYNHKKTKDV